MGAQCCLVNANLTYVYVLTRLSAQGSSGGLGQSPSVIYDFHCLVSDFDLSPKPYKCVLIMVGGQGSSDTLNLSSDLWRYLPGPPGKLTQASVHYSRVHICEGRPGPRRSLQGPPQMLTGDSAHHSWVHFHQGSAGYCKSTWGPPRRLMGDLVHHSWVHFQHESAASWRSS